MQDKSEIKKQIIGAIKDKNDEKYTELFNPNYKEKKKDIFNKNHYDDFNDYGDFFKQACESDNVFVIENILTMFDELFSTFKNEKGEALEEIKDEKILAGIFFKLRRSLFSRSWGNPATLPIDCNKTAFLVKELKALGPLFSQFHSLRQMAESRSTKTKELLDTFDWDAYTNLESCIAGVTVSPEDAFNAIKNGTNVLLWSFEKEGDFELATVLKNILLVLSVVGPFIKRLRTGEWFLENSEIAAVRQLQRSLEWTRRHDDGTLLKPLFFNDQDPGIKNSREALLSKIQKIAQMEAWVEVCGKKPTGVAEIQDFMALAAQIKMEEPAVMEVMKSQDGEYKGKEGPNSLYKFKSDNEGNLTKIKGFVNSRLDTDTTRHPLTKEYYEVIADVNIYNKKSIEDAMTKLDNIEQGINQNNMEPFIQ